MPNRKKGRTERDGREKDRCECAAGTPGDGAVHLQRRALEGHR